MNVCTITVRRRLPYARVLANAFLEHYPEGRFTALVLDDPEDEPWTNGLEVLSPSDVGIADSDLHNLAILVSLNDLVLAYIPSLMEYLITTTGETHTYLADDVCLYSPLEELQALLEQHSLVLTPRSWYSLPADDLTPDHTHLLTEGIYNPGLVAVGPGSVDFLRWWSEAMRNEAKRNPLDAQSQPKPFRLSRILDMAGRFDHALLTQPHSYATYWNVWNLEIRNTAGWTVNGSPLSIFRFEGYSPDLPHLLAESQGLQPRVMLSQRPEIYSLTRDYAARLIAAGYEDTSKIPNGFEILPGGLKVDKRMKTVYRKAYKSFLDGLAPAPPDPFDRFDPDAFIDWLNSPDPEGFAPQVPRYLFALYDERLDLWHAYPGLAYADAGRYLDWVMRYGATENQIPPELCRFDQSLRRSPADDLAEAAGPGTLRRRESLPAGLNVAGYFKAESGVGEMARLVLSGIQKSSTPYSTYAYWSHYSRQNHEFELTADNFPYGVNLICVNADELYPFVRDTGQKMMNHRYNIGLWWWELEEFPGIDEDTEKLLDEIWTGTEHVAKAVRERTDKPVHLIPVPIRRIDTAPDRKALGLPDGFMFLFTFDYLSAFHRKNPLGVIEAFSRAFQPNEGPILVIKSINGTAQLASLEILRLAATGRSDIHIVDGYLPTEDKDVLIASSDCYVSLHRAEGYGLGMAEAAALGKPVIATNYSGNLTFLNEQNSYLIGYTMSSVPGGTPPYREGAAWAEPDLDEAAAAMRDVYLNQDESKARGLLAREQARSIHTPERTAQFIDARMADIRQIQAQRREGEFRRQLKAGLTRRLGFQRRKG